METVPSRVVDRALSVLQADPRVRGVTVGGSWLTGGMDEFSDVDLTVVIDDAAHDEIMRDRLGFAAGLADLLVGFTGEHVGEPRAIICLFDNPLLHVDIKSCGSTS